jgi:hypothetical protein
MRNAMRIDDAVACFERIAAAQGMPSGEPTAAQAWNVFASFARVPFDVPVGSDTDGLLYEYGVFHFTGTPRFTLSFVRQFETLADGEHDHYIQFHCDLLFEPTADLKALGAYNSWRFSRDAASVDAWLLQIRARPEWELFAVYAPISHEVWQEDV